MLPENFDCEVYDIVRQIPAGKVVTYGQIARLIGMPNHARRVGRAMASAPMGVPCHRVVGSNGQLRAAWLAQRMLLENEGVAFRTGGGADLQRNGWKEIIAE